MTVFVLVHGTGHGGWCWRFLVPLLRGAGYDVYTPNIAAITKDNTILLKVQHSK